MQPPRPVLTTRDVTVRGTWLPGPVGGNPVWVDHPTLVDLDQARAGDYWTQVDSLTLEDALVAAGLAVRDGESAFSRGTDALARLLAAPSDPEPAYEPDVHGPFFPGDPGTEPMDAAALEAGFDRCVVCGRLPVIYTRNRYDDNRLHVAYDNALLVRLDGGYAMFFDAAAVSVVLCHDCAHAWCEQAPWLADLVDPANSHAHTDRYHGDHPDHVGWDYRTDAASTTP